MTDILKHVAVDVHQCGDYTVRADVIAESQRLLAGGCPGSPYECPCTLFATFLPRSALESLERAWSDLESAARDSVRKIAFDGSLRVALRPNDELDAVAICRWEDDGGCVPRTKRNAYGKAESMSTADEFAMRIGPVPTGTGDRSSHKESTKSRSRMKRSYQQHREWRNP